jgi:hypothetical protein
LSDLDEKIAEAGAVIDRITASARQRALLENPAVTASFTQLATLKRMRQSCAVSVPRPLAWPSWPSGTRGRLVALVQRIVHRFTAWLVHPIALQQSEFNQSVLAAIQTLTDDLLETRRICQQLSSKLQECRDHEDSRKRAM